MADTTRLSAAARNGGCNGIVDLLDGAGSTIKIYTGTQAVDPDTAIGAQVLLATLTFATPAYGAASAGVATAGAIASDVSADATGTATWFRKATSGGTAHIDGSVGTSGASMNLNTVAIVAGATVAITSDTFTIPQGA